MPELTFHIFRLPQCTYDTRITIALRNLPSFRRTPSFYNVIHEDAIWHWAEEDDDAISHNPLEDASLHHPNHPWILPDVARTEEGGEKKTHRRNEAEKNKKLLIVRIFLLQEVAILSLHIMLLRNWAIRSSLFRMMYGRPDWLDNLLEGW